MSFVTSLAGLLVVAVLVHATNYNYRPSYPYYPYQQCVQEYPCGLGQVFSQALCRCVQATFPVFPPAPFPPAPFPPAPAPLPQTPQCPPCVPPKVQLTNCACICPAVAVVNCQNGFDENCQCRPHNNPSPPPPPQCTSFLITETVTTPGERPGTPRVVEISGTRTGTPGTRSSRRRRGAGAHVIEKRRKTKTTKTRPGTRPGTVTTVPGAPGRPPTTVQVTRRIPPPCPPGYATDLGTCTCFRFA